MNVTLDKFFCKVPETKVTDKQIEFHSLFDKERPNIFRVLC